MRQPFTIFSADRDFDRREILWRIWGRFSERRQKLHRYQRRDVVLLETEQDRGVRGGSVNIFWLGAFLFLGIEISCLAAPEENKLPLDVVRALRAPDKVTLYSLEPRQRGEEGGPFYNYKVLGSAQLNRKQMILAAGEVQTVVAGWNGRIAACFNPRHALRVVSEKHTFEFILCYECNGLKAFKDGEFSASLGISGSPKILNTLLSAAGVPLSMTEEEEEADARKRWVEAMPRSIRPLWTDAMWKEEPPDVRPFRAPIVKEFPDQRQRALVLFGWLGSGIRRWTGTLWHEELTRDLLLDIPIPELVAVAQAENLSKAQLDGAARFFGTRRHSHPEDLKALPAALKKRLLDHCLTSPNEMIGKEAKEAFSTP